MRGRELKRNSGKERDTKHRWSDGLVNLITNACWQADTKAYR